VAQAIALTVKLNLVHECIHSSFVVRGAVNLLGTKNGIPGLVISIIHSVGEASHANPDAFKHTITSELVHDEMGFHITWLFVSIGDEAAHKVRLTAVKSVHKLSKRN
jgi:hypothetical protein